jgi:quinol monooxygenase YgiN
MLSRRLESQHCSPKVDILKHAKYHYRRAAKADTRESVEVKLFTPKGGFLWRSEPPKLALQDQFIWIAKFQSHAGKRDNLLEAALTHTNNVHRTEDETLSFVVLESSEDDTSLVLFERYTSKEYFEKVHKVSETMQQFRANVRITSFICCIHKIWLVVLISYL